MAAYNEAEIIEASVREWYDEVVPRIPGAEMIVVDDGSGDGTGDILERLAAELPGLRVIRRAENAGHGPAVRRGCLAAKTEFVFQTDSDRQFLPCEFWNLWAEREDHEFVIGVRTARRDGAFRKLITKTMRVLVLLVWGVWIRDANCPFRLMRREPLTKLLNALPDGAFIPMVLISILARKQKCRVKEVPVTHLARQGGTQSLAGLWKWVRVIARCTRELIWLRLNWRRASVA